jgi:hypothetical protein
MTGYSARSMDDFVGDNSTGHRKGSEKVRACRASSRTQVNQPRETEFPPDERGRDRWWASCLWT